MDLKQADQDRVIFGKQPAEVTRNLELRKKLMAFFETSDLFEAAVVLELMPEEIDFMLKERAILMAKARRIKEALSICVDQLHDAEFALQVAHKVHKWHGDRMVYHALYLKLEEAGEHQHAKRLLRDHLIPVEKLAKSLKDEESFGDELNEYFRASLVEQEKVEKELKVLRGITKHKALMTKEELLRLKVCHSVTITEETACAACGKKIGTYDFCYEHWSPLKRVFHQYCYEPMHSAAK